MQCSRNPSFAGPSNGMIPMLVPVRQYVKNGINEGKMTREMRVSIIADNCHGLYQHSTSPSADTMRAMAKQIVSAYPAMANQMSPKEVIVIHT